MLISDTPFYYQENEFIESRIPLGERESMALDTMRWMKIAGFKCYLFSFGDSQSLKIEKGKDGLCIYLPGQFDKDYIVNLCKLMRPKIVHIFGKKDNPLVETMITLRIPTLLSFNSSEDQTLSLLDEIKFSRHITPYIYSEYLSQNIKNKCRIPPEIVRWSNIDENRTDFDISKRKFITQFELSSEISTFHKLVSSLFDFPFLGIKGRDIINRDSDKMKELSLLINRKSDGSTIINYTFNKSHLLDVTNILIAPYGDESEYNIIIEALSRGIPIVSTGKGDSRYILGDSGIIEENTDKWVSLLANLFFDKKRLKILSIKSLERYRDITKKTIPQFNKILQSSLKYSKENNIMLMGDLDSKPYINNFIEVLRDKYNVFIFNYERSRGETNLGETNLGETNLGETNLGETNLGVTNLGVTNLGVTNWYNSMGDNKTLVEEEIISYVSFHNIGKCILFNPKNKIFDIVTLLKRLNVYTYCIIDKCECEFYKYKRFDKILCTFYEIERKFKESGFTNTNYISYGVNSVVSGVKTTRQCIHLCCIEDERTPFIIKAFNRCKNKKIKLSIITQGKGELEENLKDNKNNNVFIQKIDHFRNTEQEITRCHVFFCLSNIYFMHYAFYALSRGIPLVTFDDPISREVNNLENGLFCKEITEDLITRILDCVETRTRKGLFKHAKKAYQTFRFLLLQAIE